MDGYAYLENESTMMTWIKLNKQKTTVRISREGESDEYNENAIRVCDIGVLSIYILATNKSVFLGNKWAFGVEYFYSLFTIS